MKPAVIAVLFCCLPPLAAIAAPWSFDAPLAVTTPPPQTTVFHHLDSSGRRNIAAADGTVAIAWEDDGDGTPRIYLAHKAYEEARFATALQVSGANEAFEPSILALGGKRFAVAWEEDGQVWARLVQIGDAPVPGPLLKISPASGAQASLANDGDGILVVWSEREGRFGRIRALRLGTDGLNLTPGKGCPVDTVPPIDEQLYPSGAVLQGRLVVAWEDRRPRHTIIMAAIETKPASCRFSAPVRISAKPPGRNLPYGAGHGVSRVALDRVGNERLFAAWADKRDFRHGYDIWGSYYQIGEAGISVKYKYYAYRWDHSYAPQMHHKYMVIDGATLYSGSYNLSDNAEHATFENMTVWRGPANAAIVKSFEDNFESIWQTGQGKLAELDGQIEQDPRFPIVFEPMALSWSEVTALKQKIRAKCPAVDSAAFRSNAAAHRFCE